MMPARILVADDERYLRETLEAHLTDVGYDVLAVESAVAALNRIDGFDPDVVMSDVQMPGMDGFELLQCVRASRPDIDVIIFTGFGDVQGTIDAIQGGAFDYLTKPLDLGEAEHVIERCLEKRRLKPHSEDEGETPIVPSRKLVGKHPSMIEVYKTIASVARSSAPVLIRGETGTGKELVARTIHENSARADHPFVAVNCASVPDTLLESELFGHVEGAFTGASRSRRGRFETAGRGTLFLDEIGDTSLAFQAQLLRVLQEGEFHSVGDEGVKRSEARVIAATNRSLPEMVTAGTFREDLYFRLQVVELALPPLRERRSDIPLLVRHMVAKAGAELQAKVPGVPPDVMDALVARDWPGNVRELENVLLNALLTSRGPALTPGDFESCRAPRHAAEKTNGVPADATTSTASLSSVRASAERRHVQAVLRRTEGNKSEAARILEISRPTLNRIIRDHDLDVG